MIRDRFRPLQNSTASFLFGHFCVDEACSMQSVESSAGFHCQQQLMDINSSHFFNKNTNIRWHILHVDVIPMAK